MGGDGIRSGDMRLKKERRGRESAREILKVGYESGKIYAGIFD